MQRLTTQNTENHVFMSENYDDLKRNLGLFSITMLGVSATIGAGVLVLTSLLAGISRFNLLL